MSKTNDIELDKFQTAIRAEPKDAPRESPGIRRIMFAVDDSDDVVARLQTRGAVLMGDVVQYRRQLSALRPPLPRGHHRRTGGVAQLTPAQMVVAESGVNHDAGPAPQGSPFVQWKWPVANRAPPS